MARRGTHLGFEGHHHLVSGIRHVALDDEELSDSDDDGEDGALTGDNVVDFETARLVEEALAKHPQAMARAQRLLVSKSFFTDAPHRPIPGSFFLRKDNFALALSAVLKLCVEESSPYGNGESPQPLRSGTRTGDADCEQEREMDRLRHSRTATPLRPSKPTTPPPSAAKKAAPRGQSQKKEKEVHFDLKDSSSSRKHARTRSTPSGAEEVTVAKIEKPPTGSSADIDDSEYVVENNHVREMRTRIKTRSQNLGQHQQQTEPSAEDEDLLRDLNANHRNMDAIMHSLLDKNCNRLSDEKRLYLEECVLVMNGFNALDSDNDGLLTESDLEMFFRKRRGVLSKQDIKNTLWLLDEHKRGHLSMGDVKEYYFRVLHTLSSWTPISEVDEHLSFLLRNSMSGSREKQRRLRSRNIPQTDVPVKYSLAVVHNAMECFREPIFLYRLILFAALENQERQVHVLSALQQLVEKFGPCAADRKFEQLFCKSAVDLQDSETVSLTQLVVNSRRWEAKCKGFRGPLTPRQQGEDYHECRIFQEKEQVS